VETFDTYTWVILPLLVFLARFVDVALGTMRIIFLSCGRKFLAPALGFVEVFIWITAVSQIVRGAQNFAAYFAYAAGFAVEELRSVRQGIFPVRPQKLQAGLFAMTKK